MVDATRKWYRCNTDRQTYIFQRVNEYRVWIGNTRGYACYTAYQCFAKSPLALRSQLALRCWIIVCAPSAQSKKFFGLESLAWIDYSLCFNKAHWHLEPFIKTLVFNFKIGSLAYFKDHNLDRSKMKMFFSKT